MEKLQEQDKVATGLVPFQVQEALIKIYEHKDTLAKAMYLYKYKNEKTDDEIFKKADEKERHDVRIALIVREKLRFLKKFLEATPKPNPIFPYEYYPFLSTGDWPKIFEMDYIDERLFETLPTYNWKILRALCNLIVELNEYYNKSENTEIYGLARELSDTWAPYVITPGVDRTIYSSACREEEQVKNVKAFFWLVNMNAKYLFDPTQKPIEILEKAGGPDTDPSFRVSDIVKDPFADIPNSMMVQAKIEMQILQEHIEILLQLTEEPENWLFNKSMAEYSTKFGEKVPYTLTAIFQSLEENKYIQVPGIFIEKMKPADLMAYAEDEHIFDDLQNMGAAHMIDIVDNLHIEISKFLCTLLLMWLDSCKSPIIPYETAGYITFQDDWPNNEQSISAAGRILTKELNGLCWLIFKKLMSLCDRLLKNQALNGLTLDRIIKIFEHYIIRQPEEQMHNIKPSENIRFCASRKSFIALCITNFSVLFLTRYVAEEEIDFKKPAMTKQERKDQTKEQQKNSLTDKELLKIEKEKEQRKKEMERINNLRKIIYKATMQIQALPKMKTTLSEMNINDDFDFAQQVGTANFLALLQYLMEEQDQEEINHQIADLHPDEDSAEQALHTISSTIEEDFHHSRTEATPLIAWIIWKTLVQFPKLIPTNRQLHVLSSDGIELDDFMTLIFDQLEAPRLQLIKMVLTYLKIAIASTNEKTDLSRFWLEALMEYSIEDENLALKFFNHILNSLDKL